MQTLSQITWRLPRHTLTFERPCLMGIVNVTPDSFSDGGQFRANDAQTVNSVSDSDCDRKAFRVDIAATVDYARELLRNGASILDVGGESTRPGSDAIDEAEELRRVIPVIKALARELNAPISVDSYRPAVIDAALECGAEIANDVAAGRYQTSQKSFSNEDDTPEREELAEIVARSGAGVCLMHMRGVPKTMQSVEPVYERGVVEETLSFLSRRRDAFLHYGVRPEQLAYDPGIGFGKTLEQNWALIANADAFLSLGGVVLYGCSRKRFLTGTLEEIDAREKTTLNVYSQTLERRDFMTAQTTVALARRGVHVIRVHNVAMSRLALELAQRAEDLPPRSASCQK